VKLIGKITAIIFVLALRVKSDDEITICRCQLLKAEPQDTAIEIILVQIGLGRGPIYRFVS